MNIIKVYTSRVETGRRKNGWTKFAYKNVYCVAVFESGKKVLGSFGFGPGDWREYTTEFYCINKRKADKFVASVEAGNPDMTLCFTTVSDIVAAVHAEVRERQAKKAVKQK